ncbi:SHOCT domain-containing protein [Arthrobacter sp. zg-ZUI100]|uniref:SHOCT domain-containing protein n=1 Tax=Arthrobacter jiangjiafuii TaxID=2817475 RepID=UPI001AEE9018|nr:SHOCT domain-containing protein [Arthrobacter jiangjiafuii]MBP3037555.1 SHOCT domain-containing protein [Arthrobacter jiangjiafuii]
MNAEEKAKKRHARDAQRAKRADVKRRLQLERPNGFRKDIWEAKKNVFDPNLMRRPILRELESQMREGELVESLASCRLAETEALVVMTNQRLFIAGRGFTLVKAEYAYKDIDNIESIGSSMIIHAGGSHTELYMIGFQGEPMAARLRKRIASAKSGPVEVRDVGFPLPNDRPAEGDVLDLLARLAQLHDAGVLTDAEFDLKKGDLLDRL